MSDDYKKKTFKNKKNIAGRLPENSRNRFVDRIGSLKKTVKQTDQKNSYFR